MKNWRLLLVLMVIVCVMPLGGCLFDSDDDDTVVATSSTSHVGTNDATIQLTGTTGGLTAANTAPQHAVTTNYNADQIDIYRNGVKLTTADKALFVFDNNMIKMPNIATGVWSFVMFGQAAFTVNVPTGRTVVASATLPSGLEYNENKTLNVAAGDTALGVTVKSFSYESKTTAATAGAAMDFAEYTCAVLTQANGKLGVTATTLEKIKLFSPDDVSPGTLTKKIYNEEDSTKKPIGTAESTLSTVLTPTNLNKKTGSKYGLTAAAGDTTLTDWTSTVLTAVQTLLSYTTKTSVSITTAANLLSFVETAAKNTLSVSKIYLMNKTDFDAIETTASLKNSTINATDLTTANVFYWVILTESETADNIYLNYELTRYDGTTARTTDAKCYKKTAKSNGAYIDNVYYVSAQFTTQDVKDSKISIAAKVQEDTLIVEKTGLTYAITGTITKPAFVGVYVTAQNTSTAPSFGTEEVTSGTKQNNKIYNDKTAATVDMYLGMQTTVTAADTDETYLYVSLVNSVTGRSIYNTDTDYEWNTRSAGTTAINSVISPITSGTFKGYYKIKLSDFPVSTAKATISTPYDTIMTAASGSLKFYRTQSASASADTYFYLVDVDFGTTDVYGQIQAKVALVDKYGMPSSITTKDIRLAYGDSSTNLYENSIVPNFTLYYTDTVEWTTTTTPARYSLKTTYTQQARAGKMLSLIMSPSDASGAKYTDTNSSSNYALKFYVLVERIADGSTQRILDHYFGDSWFNATSVLPAIGSGRGFQTDDNLYGIINISDLVANTSYNVKVTAVAPNGSIATNTATIVVSQ